MDESKIKEIKAVEDQAAAILAKARADQARVISEAGEEGLKRLDTARQEARSAYQAALQEARRQGEKQAAAVLQDLESELSRISKSAALKEKAATEYLLRTVKEKYGHR